MKSEDKVIALRKLIADDPIAADLRISLFAAAARSFKWDSCLQPFPPGYVKNGVKDIDKLNSDLSSLPPIRELNVTDLDGAVQELLHYILCSDLAPRIKTVPKAEHDTVLAKAPCIAGFQRPQFIFEVLYRSESGLEKRFQHGRMQYPSYFAYHGSKIFNFYSILGYGLQQHLNKTALFGEGIYLSAELHVSQMFSPSGMGWSQSFIGSHLSCAAVCEYVDDPAFVKYQEENRSSEMPEKYILVKNNERIQVRYLLVYGSTRKVANSNSVASRQTVAINATRSNNHNPCIAWMASNKSWLFAGGYFLMLFAIGLMNSQNAHYMKQMLRQKINHMCNSLFGTGDHET